MCGHPLLCAGLPTPHCRDRRSHLWLLRAAEGDLRSIVGRGQETCAQRAETCAQRAAHPDVRDSFRSEITFEKSSLFLTQNASKFRTGFQRRIFMSAASTISFRVAGFARIRTAGQFTEVWRLQLQPKPQFLAVTEHWTSLLIVADDTGSWE